MNSLNHCLQITEREEHANVLAKLALRVKRDARVIVPTRKGASALTCTDIAKLKISYGVGIVKREEYASVLAKLAFHMKRDARVIGPTRKGTIALTCTDITRRESVR